MEESNQPSSQEPRDQTIAELQAQVKQLHARIAELERTPTLTAPTFQGNPNRADANKQRRWLLAGAILLGGILGVALSFAFIVTARSVGIPQSTPAPGRDQAGTPTTDAQVKYAQATVTALAQMATRLYGPVAGKLIHSNDNNITTKSTGLFEQDFIVEARFFNPYEPEQTGWDYGFNFRQTSIENEFRLYVTSDKEWSLKLLEIPTLITVPTPTIGSTIKPTETSLPASAIRTISGGVVDNLDTSGNGSNLLRLVARGGTAYFFVNDKYVATLDISARIESGNIRAGTAYRVPDKMPDAETHYEDLSVWGFP